MPNLDNFDEAYDAVAQMEESGDVAGLIAAIDGRKNVPTELAVEALGRLRAVESVDKLVELVGKSIYFQNMPNSARKSLKVSSGEYQQSVMDALVNIGSPAVPKLLAEFEGNRYTRFHVAQILGRIADPQAVPALAKYAMDDANRGELEDFVVVEALANIGLPSCIEALLKVSTQAPAGSKLAQIIAEGLGKAGWKPEKDVG